MRQASIPSYALRILGSMEALKNEAGEAYPWVPCMDAPYAWSEDADLSVRRNAALVCRRDCPALDACAEQRQRLGDFARGVWAGEVIKRRGDYPDGDDDPRVPHPGDRGKLPPLPDSINII